MSSEVVRESRNFALELIGVACPPVAAAIIVKENISNISNLILIDKIKRFIEWQDSDFDNWLKASENFQSDSAKYNETVKLLIYTIESINDEKKIDIYANLMRAYKDNRLAKNIFLRLASILPSLFYNDILYLKDNVPNEVIGEMANDIYMPIEASNLLTYGLLLCKNPNTWGFVKGNRTYGISKLGLEMVRCGIDYENFDNYSEILVERSSSDAKNS